METSSISRTIYCLKVDSWKRRFIWGNRNTAEQGSFRAWYHDWSHQRAKTSRSSDQCYQLHHNAVWIGKYSDSCACAACLDSSSLCRSSRSSKRNADSALCWTPRELFSSHQQGNALRNSHRQLYQTLLLSSRTNKDRGLLKDRLWLQRVAWRCYPSFAGNSKWIPLSCRQHRV